jgi:hypothetical protein
VLDEAAKLRDSRIATQSLRATIPPPEPPWTVLCSSYPSAAEVQLGFVCSAALALAGLLLLAVLLRAESLRDRCAISLSGLNHASRDPLAVPLRVSPCLQRLYQLPFPPSQPLQSSWL